MSRFNKIILLLLTFVLSWGVLKPQKASAVAAYKTYTITVNGKQTETQTAYEAFEAIASPEIVNPQDIVITENEIYLIDSGSKKVMVLDLKGKIIRSFGEDVLVNPTGIALDVNGDVYVADGNAEKVFRFSEMGELKVEYKRPEEPLFGANTIYKPIKVDVDVRGNIYIVGEGATNGIIQLNNAGEFLGYYGSNRTQGGFIQFLRDNLLSDLQLASVFQNVPPASSNITIDDDGIVYTVTENTNIEPVKKLNVAGSNMLPTGMYTPEGAIDIAIGLQSNFYILTKDGLVYEYDSTGNILFIFGSLDMNSQRLGVIRNPAAIEIGPNGLLYVVDSEGGIVHKFSPTAFTNSVHLGLGLYEEGRYLESEDYWKDVLNQNASFALARVALGESNFKQQKYSEALEQFEDAKYGLGYSKTFWELRNNWIEANLGFWLALLIGLFVLWKTAKFMDKKYGFLKKPTETVEAFKQTTFMKELGMLPHMIKRPIDTLYDLQNLGKGTMRQALFWYGVLTIQFLIFLYQVGFLFNRELTERINVLLLLALFLGAIFLLIVMNYLVATINDGEASLKDLFIGTIHCFAPLIIGILPVIILSNVLTINEAFLYSFSMQVMVIWTFVLVVLMIKEMHNFSGFETLKNIVLTLFSAFVLVLVVYIIYVLTIQVFDFIYSLLQEVIVRV